MVGFTSPWPGQEGRAALGGRKPGLWVARGHRHRGLGGAPSPPWLGFRSSSVLRPVRGQQSPALSSKQLLPESSWSTGSANDVIFHVERDFNYLRSSQLDVQRAWCVLLLPLALLPTSLPGEQAHPPQGEGMGTAGPCHHSLPTTRSAPSRCPASVPSPLPGQAHPDASRGTRSELMSLASGNHLHRAVVFLFFLGAFQSRELVAPPASTTLTSSDIS